MRAALLCAGLLALAGCGGSPDPEPVKPTPPVTPAPPVVVDADHDGVPSTADCADDDATRFQYVSGHRDADGDGVGADALEQVCAGAALPQGWVSTGGDCATYDATRWRELAVYEDWDGDGRTRPYAQTLCIGAQVPTGYVTQRGEDDCSDFDATAWHEVPLYFDLDGDGVGDDYAMSMCLGSAPPPTYMVATGGDCAPRDATLYTMLPYAYRDADGDGATVPQQGSVCSGFYLPAGYRESAQGLDCNDADPSVYSMQPGFPDPDGDGVGSGESFEVCAGVAMPRYSSRRSDDCAPQDSSRWEQREYRLGDADGDGRTVPLAEPASFCVGNTDPQGYSRGTPWPDDCDDADAARYQVLAYAYRDADGDGATVPATGSLCSGASLPAGYATQSRGADCDDADAQRFVQLSGFADVDADGVGAGEAQAFCTAGALPAGFVASSTDCAAQDAARWRTVTPGFLDQDGDGYTVVDPAPTAQCIGTAPEAPSVLAARGNDCEDTDPTRFLWRVFYRDEDGDGVGAAPRLLRCLATGAAPAGESPYGWDSDDADPAVQQSEEDEAVLQLLLET
ncbi:hypothetical protein FGE12_24870 [Aggregicoccus sp. 17bor-14]|uniref:hypothetical protein n=1 Tax=Myxococcaceae TaxID=31 RepID=UPI00129C5E80|nr:MULTISPECIES: hypothetical protein [Myxococcaceae]MBF5045663.1 hypothetical protein [Simulacricoccus sp. 17bor-14]MRI91400.1 hypothetical protein [Aggregicoccus sp. 17bor-14]